MESYNLSDCIFAPITGVTTGSSVIVIRISGAPIQIQNCCSAIGITLESLHHATSTLRNMHYTTNGQKQLLDQSIITYYKAPRSLTGESVIEIAIHGSPFILDTLTLELLQIKNTRYANPGEFLYRAFVHNKITISEAEATNALIKSTTSIQHQVSMQHMKGYGIRLCEKWKQSLVEILGLIEGYIDFSEEHHITEELVTQATSKIVNLSQNIEGYISNSSGEKIISGLKVTICGRPNAGKSSLFNALTQNNHSIVSSISGTTRDIINAPVTINGQTINVSDTAGITDTPNAIEQEGIRRAIASTQDSDIIFHVSAVSPAQKKPIDAVLADSIMSKYNTQSSSQIRALLINKVDLLSRDQMRRLAQELTRSQQSLKFHTVLLLSVNQRSAYTINSDEDTKIPIEKLLPNIVSRFFPNSAETGYINSRQKNHLIQAHQSLLTASQILKHSTDLMPEIISAEIQQAVNHIKYITGAPERNDILGEVFSKFCVGK